MEEEKAQTLDERKWQEANLAWRGLSLQEAVQLGAQGREETPPLPQPQASVSQKGD